MNLPSTPCLECGELFVRVPVTRKFCSARCTQAHHNRRIMGGLKLYDAAMKWRLDNSRAKKGLLTALTAIADQLASEEREIIKAREAKIAQQSKRVA